MGQIPAEISPNPGSLLSGNQHPVCPHCQHGLFAEDFKDDRKLRMVGKDYARARAGRKALEASHD